MNCGTQKAIIDLQPLDLSDTYPSFDNLIEIINTFVFLQNYI